MVIHVLIELIISYTLLDDLDIKARQKLYHKK